MIELSIGFIPGSFVPGTTATRVDGELLGQARRNLETPLRERFRRALSLMRSIRRGRASSPPQRVRISYEETCAIAAGCGVPEKALSEAFWNADRRAFESLHLKFRRTLSTAPFSHRPCQERAA